MGKEEVYTESRKEKKRKENKIKKEDRKANWICHILRMNCLRKHVMEGKTEEDRSEGQTKKT